MSFREWYRWLKGLPWSVKWFVFIVLFRPLIDGFYFLKEISPFVSPLYIVGVLTPFLTLLAVARLPKPPSSPIDKYFKVWGVLMALSLLFLYFQDTTSMIFFQYLFKLTLPLYIFLLLRYLIRSERELNGLLQTFIYSTLIVAGVFLFEIIIGPIRVSESRGLTRFQGFFGDVVNYAIYMTQGFLVTGYFFLRNPGRISRSKRLFYLFIAFALCMGILFNIHHTATLFIFTGLVGLFIWFESKQNSALGVLFVLGLLTLGIFYGPDFLEERVEPLIAKDIAVYQGAEDTDKLLHGRVGRWERMLEEFFQTNMFSQFFGVPLGFIYPYQKISAGAHNDFLRIMFYTGFMGLLVYLTLIGALLKRLKYLKRPHYFLGLGGMAIYLLFSVSTTPTMYPPMLYIIYSIFAFMALPPSILRQNNG